jgi:hypothetical protein
MFILGWFICLIKALNFGIDRPFKLATGYTDSVEYLKVRAVGVVIYIIS